MEGSPRDEWLTLSQTAKLLGVHPSTVRAWSDKGLLPVYRTRGGHRRFRRSEVELWANTMRDADSRGLDEAIRMALSRIRLRLAEGHLEQEPWYTKIPNQDRRSFRQSARKIMQGLMAHLASAEADGIALARSLGHEHAVISRRAGMNVVEATRAFLFFRNEVLQAIIEAYGQANVLSGQAWSTLLHKFHQFTDHILLALLEMYNLLESNAR